MILWTLINSNKQLNVNIITNLLIIMYNNHHKQQLSTHKSSFNQTFEYDMHDSKGSMT